MINIYLKYIKKNIGVKTDQSYKFTIFLFFDFI